MKSQIEALESLLITKNNKASEVTPINNKRLTGSFKQAKLLMIIKWGDELIMINGMSETEQMGYKSATAKIIALDIDYQKKLTLLIKKYKARPEITKKY